MYSCKSCQIKKKLYNSPLSLEEKLILHMLSSVKHSPGSYESASEMSDQTVAQCQDKLQELLSIMCSYGVSGPASIEQSFLRTFLKLCSNSVHFKKRRSIEQALSKCQEHNAGHAVGALKSTQPFLHKFQPFLPDDTIFEKNMKRYARCLFFQQFLSRKLSTNTVFFLLSVIFPITVESQHNFLRHRDLSRDLLTVSSIRRSEVQNATF